MVSGEDIFRVKKVDKILTFFYHHCDFCLSILVVSALNDFISKPFVLIKTIIILAAVIEEYAGKFMKLPQNYHSCIKK